MLSRQKKVNTHGHCVGTWSRGRNTVSSSVICVRLSPGRSGQLTMMSRSTERTSWKGKIPSLKTNHATTNTTNSASQSFCAPLNRPVAISFEASAASSGTSTTSWTSMMAQPTGL
eukprot:Amastigsp_a510538_43.p4 type:complete len:115 gc:universal Amastigsp_a510538_43:885-541(-)